MKRTAVIDSVPVILLLFIMSSQLYFMAKEVLAPYSPILVSTFTITPEKCTVAMNEIGPTLAMGLRQQGGPQEARNVLVTKFADGTLRVTMPATGNAASLFESEIRLLKPLVRCDLPSACRSNSTSGPTPDSGFAQFGGLRLQRTEISKRRGYSAYVLPIFALIVDVTGLYYLLRRDRNFQPGKCCQYS